MTERLKSPLAVAIVGLGPRGLHCFERLTKEACRMQPPQALEVDLYEPHPFPGAGPVYDPGSPHHLRMNFAARNIDLWLRDNPILLLESQLPLTKWLTVHRPEWASHSFVPRAVVGEYLHDGYLKVIRSLPASIRVRLIPRPVEKLERRHQKWHLGPDRDRYDEVLITTGHATSRGSPTDSFPGMIPVQIPHAGWLDLSQVRAGAVVAIRGFGLTCIDAILTLTEGRGGVFTPTGSHRFRYFPGPNEPDRIIPFSRSGMPPVAKPEVSYEQSHPQLAQVWCEGRQRLEQSNRPRSGLTVREDLLPVILETASAALRSVIGSRRHLEQADEMRRLLLGPPHGDDPLGQMKCSLQIAFGEREPDEAWALGEAWRRLYPALVKGVSYGGLRQSAWPLFKKVAARMERLAFGPPAENLARLVSLVDAGVVDLTWCSAPTVETQRERARLARGGQVAEADCLIDAVLPKPGIAPGDPTVFQQLFRGKHVRTLRGTHGIEVTPAGQCVGFDGSLTPGLSVIGRATEGCILGNDTLSRSLHDTPEAWATTLVQKYSRAETGT